MSNGSGARLKRNEKAACKRKVRHTALVEAIAHADAQSLEAEEPYSVYRCRWCQGLHIARASTFVNAVRRRHLLYDGSRRVS